MSDVFARWQAGASADQFSPAEAQALAEHLMERGYEVYSNPRHKDHQALSADIQGLFQRAAPGHLGPGGEAIGS
jgi:hypothetical protein